MENKYQIGKIVWYDYDIWTITDVYEEENEIKYNLIYDLRQQEKTGILEEELELVQNVEKMIEKKKPKLVKLNIDNKEVPILIDIKEYYELKEENEELRELLDIAKATIQMISELI